MTAQEIFDKVATHLLAQNAKSEITHPRDLHKGSVCVYRGYDGLKCAVGCLIEDSEYETWMEGRLVHAVLDDWKCSQSLWLRITEHRTLVGALQLLHDTMPVYAWREKLKQVANKFGLEWRHG